LERTDNQPSGAGSAADKLFTPVNRAAQAQNEDMTARRIENRSGLLSNTVFSFTGKRQVVVDLAGFKT